MVGATDGATGDGGAVKVATHGIIQTSGAGSTGLIVQSIGGGGGAAVAVEADGLVREPIVEQANAAPAPRTMLRRFAARSEEHTSALQSLMRISYAGFCVNKKHYIHVSYATQ